MAPEFPYNRDFCKGNKVITVTPQIIADQVRFDAMVRQLCKALGVRITSKRFLLSQQRRELRKQLFFWLPR